MHKRPKLLDLFCCEGGAGMGYHLAGFDVIGVDIKPQPHYPFPMVVGDAVKILSEGLRGESDVIDLYDFDVIHASPPCQRYSINTHKDYKNNHPDLLPVIAAMLRASGKHYVIENVTGARSLLSNPIMLCGSMFSLPIWRHRWFETSINLQMAPASCNHGFIPLCITGTGKTNGVRRKDPIAVERREAMQTPWMTIKGMDEAIPPAYTKWIGEQMMKVLSEQAA